MKKKNKPRIFISHITEEKDLAINFKNYLIQKFQSSIEVFVSSDMESIGLGNEWFSTIKSNLANCDLMIILCSSNSINRPWINFEAGCGSIRNIPVIPICHSGFTPDKLPYPLKVLQGGLISKKEDIIKIFKEISEINKNLIPDINDDSFFNFVNSFELLSEKSLIRKNNQAVTKLIHRDLGDLRFSIIGSTKPYTFTNELVGNRNNDFEFSQYKFKFKEIEYLFNDSVQFRFIGQSIYARVIYDLVKKIASDIQFILSNRNLVLTNELTELLYDFLYRKNSIESWQIKSLESYKTYNKKHLDKLLETIRKEEGTPDYFQGHYMQQYLIYFNDIKYFQLWIIKFGNLVSVKV